MEFYKIWEGVSGEITSVHDTDEHGNPSGGRAEGNRFMVAWQDGPVATEDGKQESRRFNGFTVEDMIYVTMHRLEYYQEGGDPAGKFACQENVDALRFLNLAVGRLNDRTRARMDRGVEGTHTA